MVLIEYSKRKQIGYLEQYYSAKNSPIVLFICFKWLLNDCLVRKNHAENASKGINILKRRLFEQ